jgi:multiple sugar transport system permease protein
MTTIARDLSVKAVEAAAHEGEVPTERKPFKWTRIPLHLVLILGAVLMFIPFVWMISSSFKPLDEIFKQPPTLFPVAPTLVNYQTAFGTGTFLQSFFNSFYIAAVVTVVSLLTCAMAAYAFARLSFPGNNLLFGLFLATMMVPIQLTIIPLYTIMGWFQLIDTHAAIILPAALFNAFGVFLLRQYVRGIPLEL